jgi:uncharacterized protein (TIGR02001 family)
MRGSGISQERGLAGVVYLSLARAFYWIGYFAGGTQSPVASQHIHALTSRTRPTMKRQGLLRSVAVACAYGAAGAAWADGSLGGSLDVTSDYIYHGLSQSGGDPAVQGDIHYRSESGAATSENFIGLWGSTTKQIATGGAYELNAYAGRTFLVAANSSATLTYVHYAYPDSHVTPGYDYDELAGTWAYQDRVFLTVAWTPDTARYSGLAVGLCCRVLSYDAAVHQSLGRGFTLSAALGYDKLRGISGYAYWNGGVAYAIGAFQLDLTYFDMQPRAVYLYGDALAGRRWVGTLVWRF